MYIETASIVIVLNLVLCWTLIFTKNGKKQLRAVSKAMRNARKGLVTSEQEMTDLILLTGPITLLSSFILGIVWPFEAILLIVIIVFKQKKHKKL